MYTLSGQPIWLPWQLVLAVFQNTHNAWTLIGYQVLQYLYCKFLLLIESGFQKFNDVIN